MSTKIRSCCTVVLHVMVVLALWFGPHFCLAQNAKTSVKTNAKTSSNASPQQWLVLKNGQALPGRITLIDHRYEVVADSGSRILIPESQARFVADSMQDIYWDKWASVGPEDGPGQVELFHWCLRNGLIEEAQNQILRVADMPEFEQQSQKLTRMGYEMELAVKRQIAEAEARRQLAIKQLNIRELPSLNGSSLQSLAQNQALNPAPLIPSLASNNRSMTRLTSESRPIDAEGNPLPMRPEPQPENKIGLASFDEESLESPAPVARRKNAAYINNAQLDREGRQMPRGTFQFFRKHIEPSLMQNCIQCHDSMAGSMPLTRRSFGNTMPRRMSQQNMHFVMKWIDKSDPLDSRMLQMALTAHGKQTQPAFNEQDEFAINMQKWSIAICHDPARWLIEFTQRQQKRQQQQTHSSTSPIETAAEWSPETMARKPERNSPAAIDAKPVPKVDPVPPKSGSDDPYDPAGFNQSDK